MPEQSATDKVVFIDGLVRGQILNAPEGVEPSEEDYKRAKEIVDKVMKDLEE